MLQKNIHPYEYMDDWEKFNEKSLPDKEDFYSHLNMEDITDSDYTNAKSLQKFQNKQSRWISWFKCS